MGLEEIVPAFFLIAVLILVLPEFLKSNKDLCILGCNNALDNAIITAPEKRDPKVLKTLDVLLQRLNK